MSIYRPTWAATPEERLKQRTEAAEIIRTRGTGKTPAPPRSPVAQPGRSKVVVTFNGDPSNHPGMRTRVYKGTESGLYAELPAGIRQCEVAGTPGIVMNVFLSFVTPTGAESRKVLVQCAPAVENAGDTPPADPTPPSGWDKEPTGGATKGGLSGTGSGGRRQLVALE
jgi:hypothetical protein